MKKGLPHDSPFALKNSLRIVVRFQNGVRKHLPCFAVYGMGNVLVFAFLGFAAGHRDKETFFAFDYFDVVYDKAIVYGD